MNDKCRSCYAVIITQIVIFVLLLFICAFSVTAQAEEMDEISTVTTFDSLRQWLEENKRVGGTVVLGNDITVPPGESYDYLNAVYRKELTINTAGHTIYVEGYLSLWPYLRIEGDGSGKELIHIRPGGELSMTGITVDAGEHGTAVVQDEGAFLIYGSEEGMDLPSFSCTGSIVSPEKISAGAMAGYDRGQIPVIRLKQGEMFNEDILPDSVQARVNREHSDMTEDIPVRWEIPPNQQERMIISGSFTEPYILFRDYEPVCLVVWESEEVPFFLNAYAERSEWFLIVHIYAGTFLEGSTYIQYSSDGENWAEPAETDGGGSIQTAADGGDLAWHLILEKDTETDKVPIYFRMVQTSADKTETYSEVIELTGDDLFAASDIDGGRGGETSPSEGEDRLPEYPEDVNAAEEESGDRQSSENSDDNTAGHTDYRQDEDAGQEIYDSKDTYNGQGIYNGGNKDNVRSINGSQSEEYNSTYRANSAGDDKVSESWEDDLSDQGTKESSAGKGKIQAAAGIGIILAIMAAAMAVSLLRRKNGRD